MCKLIEINHYRLNCESKKHEIIRTVYVNTNNIIDIQPCEPGYSIVRYWNGNGSEGLYTKGAPEDLIQRITKTET